MKLALAVVLSVCLTYVAASDCDSLERFKVMHQWKRAFGEGHHRVEFGLKVFKNLFRHHPETRSLFDRVNGANIYSPEFEAHSQRVLSGLDILIGLLDDKPTLEVQVAHVKATHTDRNVKPEYYRYLGEEIVDILPQYLGTQLDYAAFSACYKNLVAAITA